jgi:quercetin dioxygenase-like cupin family protein
MSLVNLVDDAAAAVDLTTTPIHLGRGSRARPVEGFAWDPGVLEAYGSAVADDGAEGRMVMIFDAGAAHPDAWESHPAGDEVVICLAGRLRVIREVGGSEDAVEIGPGEATVNPAGVWHTVEADGPARFMTITPGAGTEHRPR